MVAPRMKQCMGGCAAYDFEPNEWLCTVLSCVRFIYFFDLCLALDCYLAYILHQFFHHRRAHAMGMGDVVMG